ncbi:MSHA biogenesis protein MshK [Shewanella sp. AS16]|uniref:MSHA biogenesis protein MshK n=1 Tax=Shewanella sp. AS16 TaxID=2907625 RepID=UPI001F1AD561|nr:MSHA biogenesis protein MshK [Shewanella sp. AS16]MCE9685923.1 MSHA biogenesis protein MshK [Shewanella sp. AS16]
MWRNKLGVSLVVLLTGMLLSGVQAQALRDPTLPGTGAVAGSPPVAPQSDNLVLSSIVSSDASAFVVINDGIYAVGDVVQGVRIVAIDSRSVSLSDGRKLDLFHALADKQ